MVVECPVCEIRIKFEILEDHILKEHDEGWIQYYEDTFQIEQATQQKKIDHKQVKVECPCCDNDIEIDEMEGHIEKSHKIKDLKLCKDMIAFHEKISIMKDRTFAKYQRLRIGIIDKIHELKNEGEIKEGTHQIGRMGIIVEKKQQNEDSDEQQDEYND
ncbi:MAG: hypothetical protein EZS28_026803, partial [Streblomastix strix]